MRNSKNKPENIQKGEIVIYRADDGKTSLDVRLEEQTVWLNLNQVSKLFQRDKSVISRHLSNIFKSKELHRNSVVAFFATTASDGKIYRVEHFNLDAIISVGYRVNSKRGTQFRIWATNTLRDHLVKGYTIYQKRLQENQARMKELEEAVELVRSAQDNRQLSASEASGLLNVITEYARSWLLLQRYDEDELPVKELNKQVVYELSEEEAWKAIDGLRDDLKRKKEAGDLFGRENAQGKLKGILGSINQTFGGKDLYPSIEEKAANLLPAGFTLEKTHRVLQTVMGWENCHLYEFRIGRETFGPSDDGFGEEKKSDKKVTIGEALKEGERFVYTYDFGDNWEHELVFEKLVQPEEGKLYPVCVDGSRACPPEDCGGIPGYEMILQALRGPKTQEERELVQWVGRYNPEFFDLESVNRALKRMR